VQSNLTHEGRNAGIPATDAPCDRLAGRRIMAAAAKMEVWRKANDFSGPTDCRTLDEQNAGAFGFYAILMRRR
jgi:hypothetical protein